MNKYLTIILTSVISLLSPSYLLAQDTLYVEQTQPDTSHLVNSSSTSITYQTEEVITQTFYKTVEADQALIYTRGACENVDIIAELENLEIDYICRSIDNQEQNRELVMLLYDIGVAGSIPLPVIYYHQQVLLDPNLEHINVLIPNNSNPTISN